MTYRLLLALHTDDAPLLPAASKLLITGILSAAIGGGSWGFSGAPQCGWRGIAFLSERTEEGVPILVWEGGLAIYGSALSTSRPSQAFVRDPPSTMRAAGALRAELNAEYVRSL